MPSTYEPIATQTLGSAVTSVTFSSIPSGYTDLVLVASGTISATGDLGIRFNGDTGTNYSYTRIYGNGTSAASDRNNTQDRGFGNQWYSTSTVNNSTIHIMNYANTTTYKTVISRGNSASGMVAAITNLWRSTAAINSVTIFGGTSTYSIGSTFTLYGIASEGTTPAVKATGGAIYSDSTYYYHVFGSSGTFTPLQSISADVLVVAGGASGGGQYGGGGGAGGLCYQSARSLTTTGYTVTVGAGGAAIVSSTSNGNAGSNSVFDTITALGGGGGGSWNSSGANGATGGSGGGGSMGTSSGNTTSGGAATQGNSGGATGYGNAGGGGLRSGSFFLGGGGGGAGAIGGSASGTLAGAGGAGLNTWSSWLTVIGVGLDGYIAGGGGGGAEAGTRGAGGAGGGGNGGQDNSGINALINSGSGGGGVGYNATRNSGQGGSGVVIVRYLKA